MHHPVCTEILASWWFVDDVCSLVRQVKTEGVKGLYAGLSAALARQASYTTLRLGLYDSMKRAVMDREWRMLAVYAWHLSACLIPDSHSRCNQ